MTLRFEMIEQRIHHGVDTHRGVDRGNERQHRRKIPQHAVLREPRDFAGDTDREPLDLTRRIEAE
jgi:hypothetical protein